MCVGVRKCAQVYTGVRGWTRVCVGVCMRVRAGVRGYGWEGVDALSSSMNHLFDQLQ